jgi:CRISPR-associated protein Cmr6
LEFLGKSLSGGQMNYPYSGLQLMALLEKQHQKRSQAEFFKAGTFTLQWRTKVGSFPHPDVETIVSAGEPCGAWKPSQGRAEDKRNVGENWEVLRELPLHGYIPGASIRGIVRLWAKQRPEIESRMLDLLGNQDEGGITAGRVEFLDAWPETPTQLSLDIVNPQQGFQVYHEGQSTPLSLYTLGDGAKAIAVRVAIRGIPGQVSGEEVAEVWQWVQHALSRYGIGSRTASGYGAVKSPKEFKPQPDLRRFNPNDATKPFEFSLYSQGSAGPDMRTMELRAAHWRGWLRSWVLRFLLGVMSQRDAEITLGELLGTLQSPADNLSRKGCVRLQISVGETESSDQQPPFYGWKGQLTLSAPKEILNSIILPIVRVAVSVGGVGRGWRRPLHIFHMNNGRAAARGTYLRLTHKVKKKDADEWKTVLYSLSTKPGDWSKLYEDWRSAVKAQWSDRVIAGYNNPAAEVFSPQTCAVYVLPGPHAEPVDWNDMEWLETDSVNTRGDGMELVYKTGTPQNYKRNPDLGGNAGNGGAYCSWVSVKRIGVPNQAEGTECQEVVCLFMGGQTPGANHVRSRFLKDLSITAGQTHLFGVTPKS